MLAAVDVQESMAMFKSDKKIDIFARQSWSRRVCASRSSISGFTLLSNHRAWIEVWATKNLGRAAKIIYIFLSMERELDAG